MYTTSIYRLILIALNIVYINPRPDDRQYADYLLDYQSGRCPQNMVLSNCASRCPLTCQNYQNPPVCPAVCVRGCVCPNKNDVVYNKECIPKEKCPSNAGGSNNCGYNETYKTSNSIGETCDGTYIQQNKPGCYCAKGYVLNRLTGNCVLSKDCPIYPKEPVCPPREYVDNCKSPCEKTCTNPAERECPFLVCHYGCSCVAPLVRDETTGKCLEYNKCPNANPNGPCGQYEEYVTCGTECPPTCKNRDRYCTGRCVAGCFCKQGYIRARDNGPCIPLWNCEAKLNDYYPFLK